MGKEKKKEEKFESLSRSAVLLIGLMGLNIYGPIQRSEKFWMQLRFRFYFCYN